VVGGNIIGGKPVEVTLISVASLFSRGREDHMGASCPISVSPWRRWPRVPCLERHVRLECSNDSGSQPQGGQEVSASGALREGYAAM